MTTVRAIGRWQEDLRDWIDVDIAARVDGLLVSLSTGPLMEHDFLLDRCCAIFSQICPIRFLAVHAFLALYLTFLIYTTVYLPTVTKKFHFVYRCRTQSW